MVDCAFKTDNINHFVNPALAYISPYFAKQSEIVHPRHIAVQLRIFHNTAKATHGVLKIFCTFSPAELAARVKSHISRYERLCGSNAFTKILTVKNLEINTASHKVYVSGREVQLTAKEYELLLFLASNPNIVFSKEHLLASIWGQDFYGEQATVPVHIQKLRKKIEKDPSNPELIETLWGTGYRFNS
jgi:hypothetical protein